MFADAVAKHDDTHIKLYIDWKVSEFSIANGKLLKFNDNESAFLSQMTKTTIPYITKWFGSSIKIHHQ